MRADKVAILELIDQPVGTGAHDGLTAARAGAA